MLENLAINIGYIWVTIVVILLIATIVVHVRFATTEFIYYLEHRITANDNNSYRLIVPEEIRRDLPIEEWKPDRFAFSEWYRYYSHEKTADEFRAWLKDIKRKHPLSYEYYLSRNDRIS